MMHAVSTARSTLLNLLSVSTLDIRMQRYLHIGVGAQSTLGSKTFLPENRCMKKITKCQNFT